jgi:hypothetical protein
MSAPPRLRRPRRLSVWLARAAAAGLLWLVQGAAAVEIAFVAVSAEAPLQITPPRPQDVGVRLGVRLRQLAAATTGEVVVSALSDANGDDVVDEPGGREQWRRSLASLRSENLATRQGELVARLALPGGVRFDQLVLSLRDAKGRVIAGPSYLTPEPESLAARVAPAYAGFKEGAWRALNRLVRIADVVRTSADAKRLFMVAADPARVSDPNSPVVVVGMAAPPRALALAPAGEAVAWITADGAGDSLWFAETRAGAVPSRILDGNALVGLTFVDGRTVVTSREGSLLFVSAPSGHAPLAVATPFVRIVDIQRAQQQGDMRRVWLRAEAGDGVVGSFRLDIGNDANIAVASLLELPARDLLARTTASGRVCLAAADGDTAQVACVGPASTTAEPVARCRGASLVRASAAAERLVFVADTCP